MKHPSAQPLRELLKKIREGQTKLLYRHEELKQFRDDDNQKKFALLLSELSELDELVDAENQFQNHCDLAQFENDFTGLKSMNDIRWNCVLKVCKCYFDNSSKLKSLKF